MLVTVNTRHTFVKTYKTYNTERESYLNYELWVIMISQCCFIACYKYASLVRDVDPGKGVHVGRRGCMGNLCALCSILL